MDEDTASPPALSERLEPKAPKRTRGGKAPRMTNVTFRITPRMFAKIEKDAAKEGLAASEFIRRVLDLHYLREQVAERTSKRLVDIEARLAKLEAAAAGSAPVTITPTETAP